MVIDHPAPSEAIPSVWMLYLVHAVHPCSLSEVDDVESLMRKIRSACTVLNRRASGRVLDFAKTSLGWLLKLLGQGRALHGRHTLPETGSG